MNSVRRWWNRLPSPEELEKMVDGRIKDSYDKGYSEGYGYARNEVYDESFSVSRMINRGDLVRKEDVEKRIAQSNAAVYSEGVKDATLDSVKEIRKLEVEVARLKEMAYQEWAKLKGEQ